MNRVSGFQVMPRKRKRAVRFLLACLVSTLPALAGCSSSTSPQPAPAREPQKNQGAVTPPDAKQAPSPPAATEPVDEKGLLAQTEETVKAWVKALGAGDDKAVRAFCLGEDDLEKIAGEGIRNILGSSLLPENLRVAEALLTAADGKEVVLGSWDPGKIYRTQQGSPYKASIPMVGGGKLVLAIGPEPSEYLLDLVSIGGRWKILKIQKVDS